jgi:hypothetical protein
MEDGTPPNETREDPLDVHRATHNALLFGILPFWIAPGFLDYPMHRKSSIETTSGTHESLIHALQMTSIGVPTLLALLCEVNAAVIATSIGAAALSERPNLRRTLYGGAERWEADLTDAAGVEFSSGCPRRHRNRSTACDRHALQRTCGGVCRSRCLLRATRVW